LALGSWLAMQGALTVPSILATSGSVLGWMECRVMSWSEEAVGRFQGLARHKLRTGDDNGSTIYGSTHTV